MKARRQENRGLAFVWCNTLTVLAVENLKLELREAAIVVAKFRCVVQDCQD